jgi:hypothetical protein
VWVVIFEGIINCVSAVDRLCCVWQGAERGALGEGMARLVSNGKRLELELEPFKMSSRASTQL